MKFILLFLVLINWNLLYSQESETSKDTLKTEFKNNNSIIIDSTSLAKHREMNASGALLYESCNLLLINSSYFSTTSTILQRGGLTPIYSLNGVPLQINPPLINLFNIENIELSNESFNKSSSFLNGSINLTTIKPSLRKPLNVLYEGNLVSGGVLSNPIFDLSYPFGSNFGTFFMNNISLEKGKDKFATRFSYSNAMTSYNNSSFSFEDSYTKTHLSYNTLGVDFIARPSSKLSVNTNLYYAFKTVRNEGSSALNINDMLFVNAYGVIELSEKSSIKTQIGTITSSQLKREAVGSTPFYATISIEKNKNISEKSDLSSSLSYSFLANNSSTTSLDNRSNLHSVMGTATFNYLKRFKVRASLSNELYNDENQHNIYLIVPVIDFQYNILNHTGTEDINSSCVLFANYTYSNRKTNYFNLNQKIEAGINSVFFSNRIGLKLVYYSYFQKNEIYLLSPSWPDGDLLHVTFDSNNQGIEIKNSNTIIKTKRTNWIITGNFAWNRTNFQNIKGDNNTYISLGSLFPEFKYSLSSDLTYKTFSFSCLFDAADRQLDRTYDVIEGTFKNEYGSSISLRQINFTYFISKERLRAKKIKLFALSVYLKNGYTRWDRPNHYIITNYNYDTHGLGMNLRLGF